MSQNTNTIYNNLSINDTTNNTSTTISNNELNFGSNLLTIPINTTYSNSSITTPAGNIGFDELFFIRDAVGAVVIPIPASNTVFKVVDTIDIANQVNPIGDIHTNYSYDSITPSGTLTINGQPLTLQSESQINLNSNDNINLNAGVNILASNAENGITSFNTQNGTFSSGDINNSYNKTSFLVDDTNSNIFLQSTGRVALGDIGENANLTVFFLDDTRRITAIRSGQQASCDVVNNTIVTEIEEYCNFISTDTDVQMKEVSYYFNGLTPNNEGWFCYILNYSEGDIQITSNDGKQFISSTIGGFNPIGIIGEFTTVRLTLVYLPSLGDYFWSLMSGF